jgi:hypothetical protein
MIAQDESASRAIGIPARSMLTWGDGQRTSCRPKNIVGVTHRRMKAGVSNVNTFLHLPEWILHFDPLT